MNGCAYVLFMRAGARHYSVYLAAAFLIATQFLAIDALAQQPLDSPEIANLSGGLFNGTAYTMISRAPGRPNDLFVSRQDGVIYRVNLTDNSVSTFATLNANDVAFGDYWGLLGFTFSPDFATSGKMYVHVADDRAVASGIHHRIYVRKYTLANPLSNTPTLGAPTDVIRWNQHGTDHSGGYIGFQPGDPNNLWVTVGDGGNVEGAGRDMLRTGQDPTDLLSGILRLNVNGTGAGEFGNYAIPTDNPNATGAPQFATWRPEVWSIGMRSPWGGSFDRATGDFMIGDVGASQIGGNTGQEEVNFQRFGNGGGQNYAWRVMEGTTCPTSQDPGDVCNDPKFTAPAYDYPYGGGYGTGSAPPFAGRSVTGGYVYRGPVTELQGKYIFGDWSSRQIWAINVDRNGNNGNGTYVAGSRINLSTAFDRQLTGGFGTPGVTGFGEDAVGNLYFVNLDGRLFKIVGVPEPTSAILMCLGCGIWCTLVRRRRRTNVSYR